MLLLLAGGAIAYVVGQDAVSPNAHANSLLVMTIAGALAGVCVICATAHWWLRR